MSTGDGSASACARLLARVRELEADVQKAFDAGFEAGVEAERVRQGQSSQPIDMAAVMSSGGVKHV